MEKVIGTSDRSKKEMKIRSRRCYPALFSHFFQDDGSRYRAELSRRRLLRRVAKRTRANRTVSSLMAGDSHEDDRDAVLSGFGRNPEVPEDARGIRASARVRECAENRARRSHGVTDVARSDLRLMRRIARDVLSILLRHCTLSFMIYRAQAKAGFTAAAASPSRRGFVAESHGAVSHHILLCRW